MHSLIAKSSDLAFANNKKPNVWPIDLYNLILTNCFCSLLKG